MKKIIIMLSLVAGMVLQGCQNKEYLYQDVSARIWLGWRDTAGANLFTRDSSVLSFLLLPAEQETDTLYVFANVTGTTAPKDRPFKLEVDPAGTNVQPADYTIGEAVIPANSFSGKVPVTVKKNVTGIDTRKERAVLKLRLMPNEHFLRSVAGTDTFRVVWFNFLPRPESWSAVEGVLGVFTQAKYKFIIDFFGESDFEKYRGNINMALGLQSALRGLLQNYNANPANQGRPEGWPYLNDDGTPLSF